jgi:hypothetical protein
MSSVALENSQGPFLSLCDPCALILLAADENIKTKIFLNKLKICLLRVLKIIETESETVITRGWGGVGLPSRRRVLVLQNE